MIIDLSESTIIVEAEKFEEALIAMMSQRVQEYIYNKNGRVN